MPQPMLSCVLKSRRRHQMQVFLRLGIMEGRCMPLREVVLHRL